MVSEEEAKARARRLKLVLTDVDGVLTDAGVYYSDAGEELRRFSVRDGMGVERLRHAGIATGLLSRERAGALLRRAEKLSLRYVYLGVQDKRGHLARVLRDAEITCAELAYIGDDSNDLELLQEVGREGLTAAPADAISEVLAVAHFQCTALGGHGAFREFSEWILRTRGLP